MAEYILCSELNVSNDFRQREGGLFFELRETMLMFAGVVSGFCGRLMNLSQTFINEQNYVFILR